MKIGMKRLSKYIVLSFSLFVFGSKSEAQKPLSLSDAIKIGLENNFQLEIADYNMQAARINNTWGEAGALPTIDLNFNQNNNISDQSRNPTSFIQDKLTTNSLNEAVALNWTIFNGFKVKTTKERLELMVKQSEGNAALVVENSLQSIVLAYYNCLLQKEKLGVLQILVDNSSMKYEHALSKSNLGVNSSFDALQFKNAYLTDTTNYLMQQLAYKNSLRNLLLVMGIDSLADYELSGKIEPVVEVFQYNDLKTKMLKNNQTLINQFLNMEMMSNSIDLAETALYPVISFSSGIQMGQNHFKAASIGLEGNGSNLNYYANFTLNYRIFQGGKVKRGLQIAKLQEKISEVTKDEMEFKLNNQLQGYLDLYETRLAILSLATETYNSTSLNMELADERFKGGVINSFNLRDIEIAFLNSAIMRLEASYNLYSAYVDLLRVTGGIIDVAKE
jgi:outer membrane protein